MCPAPTLARAASTSKPVQERPASFFGLAVVDVILIGAAAISLFASCVLTSSRKLFWNDEIITWVVTGDVSIRHMLWAVAHGCDGAAPLYHLLLRGWESVAGRSILSLRLFSSVGFIGALAALWITLRRHLRVEAVALALLTVWCTSRLILAYNAEARNYGLYAFTAAACIAVTDRMANSRKLSGGLIFAAGVIFALFVYSHYFALFYGTALLGVLVVSDRLQGALRPIVYAAIAVGLATLIPWAAAIRREAALVTPSGYLNHASFSSFVSVFTFEVPLLPLVGVGLLWAVSLRFGRGSAPGVGGEWHSIRFILVAALVWTALPIVLFAIVHSFFFNRYLLPSTMGFAILLAIAADRFLPRFDNLVTRLAGCVLLLGLLAWPLFNLQFTDTGTPAVQTVAKIQMPDLPTVVVSQPDWMQLTFYSPKKPARYYYVLDREIAYGDPLNPLESLFFNERIAWKNAGFWGDRTVTTDEFLCRFNHFAVLDSVGRLWFKRRVQQDPAFTIESMMPIGGRVLAVIRRSPAETLPQCQKSSP